MKSLFIGCMILFAVTGLSAQTSNAVLFTENGEKFTVILNGLRQNNTPETNVKITGLNAEFYKLKIIFDNQALGEKNMNLQLQYGSETSYCIKKNNKGEYVLRFVSQVPLAEAPASSPAQSVIVYNASPAPAPVQSYSQTTTTTTTTQGTSNPDAVNVSMGVNVGGQGGSLNINMSGMDMESSSSSQTVTHSSTVTTTTTETAPPPAPVAYLPGYSGPIGCPVPMSPSDFSSLKQTIASKTFEDTRMTIAKSVLSDRCVITSQVKELCNLFTFEENKLEIAKFAYDHTYDIGNYFKVNDVFTFETSVEELNTYIQSRR